VELLSSRVTKKVLREDKTFRRTALGRNQHENFCTKNITKKHNIFTVAYGIY